MFTDPMLHNVICFVNRRVKVCLRMLGTNNLPVFWFHVFCRLYEIKDDRHADAFRNNVSLAGEYDLPLGERVAALRDRQQASGISSDVKLGPGGSREISFRSRSSTKYREDDEDKEAPRGKRRGIQSLGLKSDRTGFGGRGRGSRGRGLRGRGPRGRGRGGRR